MGIRRVAPILFAVLQVRVIAVAAQATEVTQQSPPRDGSQPMTPRPQRPAASSPSSTSPSLRPQWDSDPMFSVQDEDGPSGNRRQSQSTPEVRRGPVQNPSPPATSSPTSNPLPVNSTRDLRRDSNRISDPNQAPARNRQGSSSLRPDSSQIDPPRQNSIRIPDQTRKQTLSQNSIRNPQPIQAGNPQNSVRIPNTNSSRTAVSDSQIRITTVPSASRNRSQSSAQAPNPSGNLTPEKPDQPIPTQIPTDRNGTKEISATEAATKASGQPQEARGREAKATTAATEATSSTAPPPPAGDGNDKVVLVSDRVASSQPPTTDEERKSPRMTVQTQIYILSATFGGLLFMLIVLVLALALAIARMRSQLESTREAKYLHDDLDNPSLQGASVSPAARGGSGGDNNVGSYVNSAFSVGHEMEERASRSEPQTDLNRLGYEVYNGGGAATNWVNNQERGSNPVIPRARTLDESRRHQHKLSMEESVVPSGHDRRNRESEEQQRRSRVY